MQTLTIFLNITITALALLMGTSQAAYCVGQGPGKCQLDIQGHPVYTDGGYKYAMVWKYAYIYDHSCKKLGYIKDPLQGVAIDSQLPLTVVITWLRPDTQYFEFCYGASCYRGGFWCQVLDQGGSSVIECLHSFDCANMERMVSHRG